MQTSNNKRKKEDVKSAPGASQPSSSAPRGRGVVATSRGRGVAPETPAGHPRGRGRGVVTQVPRGTAVGRGRGRGVGRGGTTGVRGGRTASTQQDDTQLLPPPAETPQRPVVGTRSVESSAEKPAKKKPYLGSSFVNPFRDVSRGRI
ncbi:hypothetical protein FRC03_004414 [Tulasnella sp. 419]|nr:hypothetical protein FRC03_004414 [Tulasnella sp. 419]